MIAGIDFSTKAVDVVLLDEDTDAATWHRFELQGQDAFDRARDVRRAMSPLFRRFDWDDVLAIGIEDPRGYNAGVIFRVQGAILAELPSGCMVHPWVPSQWRRQVGLPGNASKYEVAEFAHDRACDLAYSQDACDAYCIALATRQRLEIGEAA